MTIAGGTVFGVYVSDCRYEGGGVDAVFSTRQKAIEYALAVVETEREESELRHAQLLREECTIQTLDPWTEEAPGVWGDGMQLVSIVEFVVDDLAPFEKLKEKRAWNQEYEAQHKVEHAVK